MGPAAARRHKPTSDGTLIRELGVLRAALAWARRARWITGELPYIELPTQPRPRERFLSRDEADRLLACAGMHHVKTFLALCLYTAGRSGAIRELTWDRVDLSTGRIDLGQAVWRQGARGGADRRQAAADP